ncbi:CLUMA_CG015788, isoform A [Clunio marinus]|uniref:CLUMA_CG015788, isoform A n=1 Tax=Clunio marinus TaxID=568069 RepID=A0A1J1IQX9_9DIPT|nr:CLUMA_CG015788, isoform A [Clunio marinus]
MEYKSFFNETEPNYGSLSSEGKPKVQRTHSIIYCVHGKAAADCCDPETLDIKTFKEPTDSHCHRLQPKLLNGIDKVARMSFGFHRAEVIGALTSVLLIWVITGILVYWAIVRVINREYDVQAEIMLITSAFGILVNVIMGCSLHGHGHGHEHGSHTHSHGDPKENHSDEDLDTVSHTSRTHDPAHHIHQNINVRAAMIHVISDFVQSCGVFIAAIFIFFKPEWGVIDPICTFMFSILVLFTTVRIMKDTLMVLMEAKPEYLDYTEIMKTFLSIKGVLRVHNLRIWALSINKVALAAHLAVDKNTNTETVLREATVKIHAKYDFFETTLQIEIYDDDMDECKDCTNP